MYIYVWFFRSGQSLKDENESEPLRFSEEDWEQLNKIIGYREGEDGQSLITHDQGDVLHTSLEVHMNHNASKLMGDAQECLAELSCESLDCSIRLYSEAKVFDMKLGSYRLSSPNGLLAEVWFFPFINMLGMTLFCRKPGYCCCIAYILTGLYPNHFLRYYYSECNCLWFFGWCLPL